MLCGSFLFTLFCNVFMIPFRAKLFTKMVQREVASCDLLVPKLAAPYSVHNIGTTVTVKSASINNKISSLVPVAVNQAVCVLAPDCNELEYIAGEFAEVTKCVE